MRRRRKSSPAVTQQHRQILPFMVGKRKIEAAIPIEVADGNIVRTMTGRKRRSARRRKASLTVSQQHGSIAALLISRHDIELAIAVKIGDRYGTRHCSYSETPLIL